MRIGILTDAFPPAVGGMEVFAGQFVRELAAADPVTLVDVYAFEAGEDERSGDLRINRCDVVGSLARWRRGILCIRKHDFDVVHSLTLYPSGMVAAVADRLGFASQGFVTVYGTDALGIADDPTRSLLRRFIFRSVSEVLFFSGSTRRKTHAAYPCSFESRTIYPGRPSLSTTDEPVDMPETDGSFTVVTVCRLVERKGIADLIAAVAALPDVALWIIGGGPQRGTLEREVRRRNVGNRIAFVGEVDHDCIAHYYRAADVFCLPSVHLEDAGDVEGLGLVFLEAQQLGLPVVGTDSGGIPEAIADGESGFVVEESSPEALRTAIKRLAADSDLYREFSENAVEFVERRFSWERCVCEHLDAYGSSP